MSQNPAPADVDDFLDSTVLDDDPVLSAVLEASDAAGLPKIAVSSQQGKFLSLLAAASGARRILEIGTLGGFSTIWLARGAGPDGQVTTLEYEPKHAEVARANIDRAGLGERVEVLVGAALDTLLGTRKVLELMGEHPQLDTAVLQTVGAKHWDGLAFALVK